MPKSALPVPLLALAHARLAFSPSTASSSDELVALSITWRTASLTLTGRRCRTSSRNGGKVDTSLSVIRSICLLIFPCPYPPGSAAASSSCPGNCHRSSHAAALYINGGNTLVAHGWSRRPTVVSKCILSILTLITR